VGKPYLKVAKLDLWGIAVTAYKSRKFRCYELFTRAAHTNVRIPFGILIDLE
jgi:hypothetical protein